MLLTMDPRIINPSYTTYTGCTNSAHLAFSPSLRRSSTVRTCPLSIATTFHFMSLPKNAETHSEPHLPYRSTINRLKMVEYPNEQSIDDDNSMVNNDEELASSQISSSPSASALHLLTLLKPNSKCVVDQVSPTSLAYIGDVVFELLIRSRYVWPSRKTSDLQNTVVNVVRAESQSKMLQEMVKSFPLTAQEKSILKRGRNAGSSTSGRKRGPKRLYAKGSGSSGGNDASVYQDSTALEALIGYTYIKDTERCLEMFDFILGELDRLDE